MERKKPSFPVNDELRNYLYDYNRNIKIPIFYEDLLRFQGSVNVFDDDDNDTLWIRVYFNEFERDEIDLSLKRVYTILHSDGNETTIPFLNIDAIDFCTFGNSNPFRIKVRNILNDNYTYFYVKKADASRIYGLELEHMLSPHNLNFLVHKETLIEEHIVGVPGDVFISTMLPNCNKLERSQIAKEFVKFNERCMIRLLGDMRSYNYVIIPTHDFDKVVYHIRAIDFDQQCYEGNFNIYRPQYFKENRNMVTMVSERLSKESVHQYKIEERSMIAKRIRSYNARVNTLIETMIRDKIAPETNIHQLRAQIYKYTKDMNFKHSKSMGEILMHALNFVKRNYEDVNTNNLFGD